MRSFRDIWSKPPRRILILDGGVSTELEELFGRAFPCRCLWSSSLLLDHADLVQKGHEAWKDADIWTTVTYQCHYQLELLSKCTCVQTGAQMDDLYVKALQTARLANQRVTKDGNMTSTASKIICISSGCFGSILANGAEYTGDYGTGMTKEVLQTFHQSKLDRIRSVLPSEALVEGGVAIETIPSHLECQALVDLLQHDTFWHGWISLSCRNDRELNDGTPLEIALGTLQPLHSRFAVGINCFNSDHLEGVTQRLLEYRFGLIANSDESYLRQPIVLYPNSGEEWDANTTDWKDGTGCRNVDVWSNRLLRAVQTVEDAYAEHGKPPPTIIVGGCCRTSPAAISILRNKVQQHLSSQIDDNIELNR